MSDQSFPGGNDQPPQDHSQITGPFTNVEDINAAMKDHRYNTDTAYQAKIVARLDQTPQEAFQTSKKPVDPVEAAVTEDRLQREAAVQAAAATLDYSSVTPILDSEELKSLMRDERYRRSPAFRKWVELRLSVTPESPYLGIRTNPFAHIGTSRHQIGRND